MDRVTRHLVFHDAPHAGTMAEQRADSDDDVFGSSPSYFLDGGKDVWTPSPDRESKLEVVRSGSLYDLRAYRGERKPSKLYDEDEQEQYRVPPPNISPEKARELEDERREVIRSQVMRKSSTMAERWSSMDELSSINTTTPVDPENIDTEQINFSAARQQFLMLEKTNPGSFVSPGQQAMSYPTGKMSALTKASSREDLDSGLGEMYNEGNAGYTSDGSTSNEVFNGLVDLRDGSNGLDKEMKISNETPIEREIRMAMEREENLWKERGIPRLTSSSELVEIQTKPLLSMLTSPGPGRKGKDRGRASLYLQREIEQETKREEALKKQGRLLGTYDRGTQQELDERRRVFEQEEAPPQKPIPTRNADEQRIWIREFVVQQPPSHSPHHTEDTRGGRSLPSSTLSTTHFQGSQPRFTASEKSQDQPLVSQHVSASTSKWGSKDSWGGRLPGSTPSPPGTTVLPREYFSFSFWKPKVSFVDEMGTQSPLRREDSRDEQYKLRTWKPQTSAMIEEEIRSDLQREEELQEQRRQRQLIDGYSVVSSDGFPQEDSRSRHSSGKGELGQGTGTSLLPSRVSPVGVAPSHPTAPLPGSLTPPPAPVPPVRLPLGISLRGCCYLILFSPFSQYAGIEPVDKINTEVVESTRVVRHKSAMAQRWEAGQYVRDED
uniref:A-kinase anchor protein 2 C-terminal domain-containing protein n=1 Tax=Calidris pygmaea TaxID=425635 RepID=A0A8C3K589_9CHAR